MEMSNSDNRPNFIEPQITEKTRAPYDRSSCGDQGHYEKKLAMGY
jgi:hypothetical protein